MVRNLCPLVSFSSCSSKAARADLIFPFLALLPLPPKTRQSNARLVRWTDGSLSLQLGAPSNLFNLTHYPSNAAHPKAFMANTLYGAQLMQSEAALAGHISLVPANLQGEMHRKLAKSVKGRNVATGRLKTWDDENMVALNVENGKKDKKGKGAKKTGAGGGGAGGGARKKVTGPSAKRQSRRGSIYSEDSDSEVDVPAKRRGAGASQGKKGKRDDEEGGQYKEDGFVVRSTRLILGVFDEEPW
jgi:RNA polymerase-associated protein LEO1